ncbi:hypothetical protein LV28_12165 [Pandoraea pnomenusa]|uniref:Uncharacterized protein n=1 Tax=Pandoraea pnomenusa TaxID=93220 RepID=A0A378YNM7_9BURK|nr:hypothetical protein [Pandoraea pnomenusa]AIU27177.1 hypothetical protein LV28_12165 [Pandoraea pnomenusa]SUA78190.1 Uncharacterised protein [Pandoraea pnomenusa]
MSIAVPTEIRDRIRQKIWSKADELGWSGLSDLDRTVWYENWSKDKDVGGALAHFMDARRVRVYIKDSLLKPYLRTRLEDNADKVLLAAGLGLNTATVRDTYDKPHGRLLTDGKIICWGNSRDWKSIVISVFERAYKLESGIPHAAVLIETGRTTNDGMRDMIVDMGRKLGLGNVVWMD